MNSEAEYGGGWAVQHETLSQRTKNNQANKTLRLAIFM